MPLRVHAGTTTQGSVAAYGTSCGPRFSATSTPRLGLPLGFDLDLLPAGTIAAQATFGLSSAYAGALVLPLPLDSL